MNKVFELVGRAVIGGIIGFAVGYVTQTAINGGLTNNVKADVKGFKKLVKDTINA